MLGSSCHNTEDLTVNPSGATCYERCPIIPRTLKNPVVVLVDPIILVFRPIFLFHLYSPCSFYQPLHVHCLCIAEILLLGR